MSRQFTVSVNGAVSMRPRHALQKQPPRPRAGGSTPTFISPGLAALPVIYVAPIGARAAGLPGAQTWVWK